VINPHEEILTEIIAREGACLDSNLCRACPFQSTCLPKFLTENPPTQDARLQNALVHLMDILLNEEQQSIPLVSLIT
jgi:hypothetical protein